MEKKAPAIEPVESKEKLSLAKTSLTNEQIKWFTAPVNYRNVYVREGKGGKQFRYVKSSEVKKVLNYVFGIDGWDFEVGNIVHLGNQIVVPGRLTIRFADGKTAVRTQFGGATAYDGVELGDSYKKACSLALTKCASEFGFAPNIYNSNEKLEIIEEKVEPVKVAEPTPNQIETIKSLSEKIGVKVDTPATFDDASKKIKDLSNMLGGK